MKLQLSPQSLRLRLAAEELPEFDQTGQLTQQLDLGAGPHLTYALRRLADDAPDAPGLRVRYAADVLTVELPAALARQLMSGEAVSLRGEARGTDGQSVRITVEKDLGPSH